MRISKFHPGKFGVPATVQVTLSHREIRTLMRRSLEIPAPTYINEANQFPAQKIREDAQAWTISLDKPYNRHDLKRATISAADEAFIHDSVTLTLTEYGIRIVNLLITPVYWDEDISGNPGVDPEALHAKLIHVANKLKTADIVQERLTAV